MVEQFLLFVYRTIRYRAWWVLLGVACLAIIALIYTFVVSDLQVRGSFLDLLPQRDPLIQRFEEGQVALERIDYLKILIELRDPPADEGDRERLLREASSRVIAQLKASPEIVEAADRPDVALPEVMIFAPGGRERLQELLGYAERIAARLPGGEEMEIEGDSSLSELYRGVNAALEEALAGGASGEGQLDPEYLSAELSRLLGVTRGVEVTVATVEQPQGIEQDVAGLRRALAGLQQEAAERVFFSYDKGAILINARPRLPSQIGVDYCWTVTQIARQAVAAANLSPEEFSVGLGGSYVGVAENDQLIKRDMRNTTIISSIGVALIFILAFGRVFFPLLATVPLFLAMLLSLGWAKLATGGLNLITTFLPSLIMGLGIDYGVHFIARYLNERERGQRIGPALRETILKTGRATVIAGATTGVVLLSLLFARSRGIFEMGTIAGVGIFLALAMTIFVLPALIVLSHLALRKSFRKRRSRYRLRLERPVAWVLRRPRATVGVMLLLSLALLYPASQVKFQFVSQDLVPRGMNSQLVREKIVQGFDLEQVKLGDYFVFFAPSEEELERVSSGLGRLDLVESVDSLADYLSPEIQAPEAEELSLAGGIAAGRRGLELVQANLGQREPIIAEATQLIVNLSSLPLLSSLYGEGEMAKTVNFLIQELTRLVDSLKRIDPARISANIDAVEGQLAGLSDKVEEVFPAGDPFARAFTLLQDWFKTPAGEFVIYAKVDQRIYEERHYTQFIAAASQITEDFFGAAMIQDRLQWYMERDFCVTTAISALLVLALLWENFRRHRKKRFALLALLPLILGYLWMLAGMRFLGLEFNFANILISPLLIGLGIDNGVHLLHRYLEDRKIEQAAASIAPAILVTSATTMLVFGSLLLARTPGLQILGKSALLGLGFTALFSLTFLPALVALRD